MTMHINGGDPVNILKKSSSYKVGVNSGQTRQETKLSFADDHGEVIGEDFYVEHLHYSPSSMTSRTDGPKNCCVVA
eukprot:CAMPEP_0114418322 /NCGR_PEP_ID=MMETSP0103-20121206/3434_1 /TAXON_ID=37642 ORGANISM="Paraphysomonas imperforata, Strain PA2" /NCGR_SAMPLE_ID=MMETSP0103 /ASSEMBLY_ACC=CAM_ASM_000201 /LENGTH=75 /DNA_ID=CAMNT_0001586671 /DNA_START=226 /DNA_END=453 /DNA_ORIENTATION=-